MSPQLYDNNDQCGILTAPIGTGINSSRYWEISHRNDMPIWPSGTPSGNLQPYITCYMWIRKQ